MYQLGNYCAGTTMDHFLKAICIKKQRMKIVNVCRESHDSKINLNSRIVDYPFQYCDIMHLAIELKMQAHLHNFAI